MTNHPEDETLKDLNEDYGNIPQLKVIDIDELRRYEFKPREIILSPWFQTQSAVMLHAIRGVGKTHASLGIAYAIASGSSFLLWDAPKPRGVLFVDGEMPGHGLQERIERIACSSNNKATAPLRFITPDLQKTGLPDLATNEGQLAIEKFIDNSIDVIILDNLSSLVRSGRENEAESWQPIQDWVLRLRAKGKSILIIHHSNKNGGQRGTSRREDILDAVICLKRPENYTPDEGALFEVHFEKSRYMYGDEVKPFSAQLKTDGNGMQSWIIDSAKETTYDKVISLYNSGLEQNIIAEKLDIDKSNVSRHIAKARNEGKLTR